MSDDVKCGKLLTSARYLHVERGWGCVEGGLIRLSLVACSCGDPPSLVVVFSGASLGGNEVLSDLDRPRERRCCAELVAKAV